jgi:hypothetical protein
MTFSRIIAGHAVGAMLVFSGIITPACAQAPKVADADVVEAYDYMLARWLVLRQETLDFKAGFKWNVLVHDDDGHGGANPALDVATSGAWIAVDETSCTLIDLPEIKGRYYNVEIVNGWGEVIDNINERTFPGHPSGTFALCLNKANVALPAGAQRVEVAGNASRILVQIALGADPAQGRALQHAITLRPTGTPRIDEPPALGPDFAHDALPGVEAFDKTEAALEAEPDINKGMAEPQGKARAVAKAAADPAQRAHLDGVIRNQAIPAFLAEIPRIGRSVSGWIHPRLTGNYGSDYLMRSLVDYADIWANTPRENVRFDATGFDGGQSYIETFSQYGLPAANARYAWSVTAYDSTSHRVLDNAQHRASLNDRSGLKLNADGSLTIAFGPKPPNGVPQSNWLPTTAGQSYDLTYRFYGPSKEIILGRYYPPLLSIVP